jgi:hypothetical protein
MWKGGELLQRETTRVDGRSLKKEPSSLIRL